MSNQKPSFSSRQGNKAPRSYGRKRKNVPENTPLIQNNLVVSKANDSKIMRIARIIDKATILGANADVIGAITFKLNDLPESASFTDLYDMYRIDRVDLCFIPLTSKCLPVNGSNASSGILFTAVDFDDSAVPGSITTVLNYQNAKMHPAGSVHNLSLQPHVAVAAYTGVFTSFANQQEQWIDCGSDSVIHFGVKYAILGSTNWPSWKVISRYHISFRSPR